VTVTREPVDVPRLIKDRAEVQFAVRFPELTVALELPSTWELGSDPVLVIADDGDPLGSWPVATSPTIRVTSWTSGRDRTYAHAALGWLLSTHIPGIASVLPGTGVLDARDKATQGDLASFTVLTRVKPVKTVTP
jgi:hypothetical protein